MSEQANDKACRTSGKELRLFGNHVLLMQRKRSSVVLHLPSSVSSATQKELYEFVVSAVGPRVECGVEVGDVVMAHIPQAAITVHPVTGEACAVVQEGMLIGVVRDSPDELEVS